MCLDVVVGSWRRAGGQVGQSILDKAGIHVGVCEMPRVGRRDAGGGVGRSGVAQVHGLAADAKAVALARWPSEQSKLLGSQVVIEAGSPAAIPLADWVADLVVVADATDENLPALARGRSRACCRRTAARRWSAIPPAARAD